MSEFKVRFRELGQIMDSMEQLQTELQQVCEGTLSVRRKLRAQFGQRERIKIRLGVAARRIEQQRQELLQIVNAGRDAAKLYERAEQQILNMSDISYDRPSGEELLRVPDAEKDETIDRFEKENPELARTFDEFLKSGTENKLSDDDIRAIKYMTYSANEPFRSLFLASLSKYSIGNGDINGGAYYQPGTRTVNYSYTDLWDRIFRRVGDGGAFSDDPRGAYTTFFHECGHAIDDVSDLTSVGGCDTETFRVHSEEMGRSVTLREAILYDVYHNKNNPHSMVSIARAIKSQGVSGNGSNGNVNKVVEALQTNNTDNLSKEDMKLYRAVVNQHRNSITAGAKCESVSDVYGGVSNNVLRNGYGHAESYWLDQSKAPKELWAEYFSYNMSGSQENMAYLLEYFPEAAKVMEQYACSLGQK